MSISWFLAFGDGIERAGLLGHSRYPRMYTRGIGVFISQTPYPGRPSVGTTLVVHYHDASPVLMPRTPTAHSTKPATFGRWQPMFVMERISVACPKRPGTTCSVCFPKRSRGGSVSTTCCPRTTTRERRSRGACRALCGGICMMSLGPRAVEPRPAAACTNCPSPSRTRQRYLPFMLSRMALAHASF
jgi:hypothetical protein